MKNDLSKIYEQVAEQGNLTLAFQEITEQVKELMQEDNIDKRRKIGINLLHSLDEFQREIMLKRK